MPANLENSAVATGLEKVSFHSNPKASVPSMSQVLASGYDLISGLKELTIQRKGQTHL